MADLPDSAFLDDPEFQSVLVTCLQALQQGETIDRETLLKKHPRFAASIEQFLDDRRMLEQLVAGFGPAEEFAGLAAATEQTVTPAAAADDFSVGDCVRYIGEYEILEEIARGGMGVVFRAKQQSLRRFVALKMILAGKLADSTDVERFRREAQAAGGLDHPGIVSIHEIGEHEGRHYFTMDFVEGQSLAELIRQEPLSARSAADLVRRTALAVHHAHEQGTVHRDLKPANVLIDSSGRPRVTDFGLARLLESAGHESSAELTASGQILGTPSYMAPEQAAGQQDLVGPSADIYALGAILYASLTGRAPFTGNTPIDTLMQAMNNDPVSPRDLVSSVPRDLETICLKCLEKTPANRYQSAQELAEDLQRFLDDEPVTARPLSTLTRMYRWSDRNVGRLTGILIAFLLLLPAVSFVGFGLLFGRWPLQLLLFSYPLLLSILAPFALSILLWSGWHRAKRRSQIGSLNEQSRRRSIPLLVAGSVVLAGVFGGWVWVLSSHGLAVPPEARWLALLLIAGCGLLIRGLGFGR